MKKTKFLKEAWRLLKPGGSATAEKPEGTFFISILFNHQVSNFRYLILGTPIERLNQLTEYVAKEILNLLKIKK